MGSKKVARAVETVTLIGPKGSRVTVAADKADKLRGLGFAPASETVAEEAPKAPEKTPTKAAPKAASKTEE